MTRRRRTERPAFTPIYKPGQCHEHFVPHVKFTPRWFIDCGPGSAGEHLCARRAWPMVNLLGLEPSTVGFEAASRLWPGGDPSAVLINKAVWDSVGSVLINRPGDLLHGTAYPSGEAAEADTPGDQGVESITVQSVTLDYLDALYGPFEDACLWIDVEGAERRALRGGAGVLSRGGIRAVNIEVRPGTSDETDGALLGYGFRKVYTYFECATVRDEVWVR